MPGMKERASAPMRAAKMPSWAAAPKSSVLGLAMSGPKSVIAPTPMKIRIGKRPLEMPMSKRILMKPASPVTGSIPLM